MTEGELPQKRPQRRGLLAGIDGPVLVDLDDTIIEVHGYAKHGSGYGYSGVRGLNALIATVTTAGGAPVIIGQRLRKGSCGSPRGAARIVGDTLATVTRLRGTEATGTPLLRADSAFYGHPTVAAALRGGADVSITVRLDPKVKAAIAGIDTWRFHAFFTTSDLDTVTADKTHRGHAIIEQVHADLKSSALAHLPSGRFPANGAWLVLAVMAFNLTRAAAALTGPALAKARTATIRRTLITVPARIASSARRLTLHLPRNWPWKSAWNMLFQNLFGRHHPRIT